MGDEFLSSRRKALEDSFFHQMDKALLELLKEQAASEKRRQRVAEASGIKDEKVLEHLIALDLGDDTIAALSLIPLIEVAWADGKLQDAERAALLSAAIDSGLEPGSVSYRLFESWLSDPPHPQLLETWKEYIAALCRDMKVELKNALQEDLLGRAEAIAKAAGGILGLGNKVAVSEKQVLDELKSAFT